jgi:hypothetical protein
MATLKRFLYLQTLSNDVGVARPQPDPILRWSTVHEPGCGCAPARGAPLGSLEEGVDIQARYTH